MSVLDAALEFSDAQSLVASSGAVTQSTNVPDMRTGLKDAWGNAIDQEIGGLVWNCNLNTTMAGAGAVVTAKLMSHSAATSIKSGTELARFEFPALSPAGLRKSFKMMPGMTIPEKYLGVTYTVSGGNVTAGKMDSFMSLDNEKYD